MNLTLGSLASDLISDLGRTPGRSTVEALINEAGEAWVNGHSWIYLRDRTQTINLVAGTEDYQLSLGVRAVNTVLYRPDSIWAPIPVMDYDTFIRERERYLSSVALNFTPIATVRWGTHSRDAGPRLYLQVYPATTVETVVVRYQAGWLPLNESHEVADIPPPMTHGFREWVRRYAQGREKQPQTNVDAAWVSFFNGPIGLSAKKADSSHVGRIIASPGGAGTRYARSKARRAGFASAGRWYDRYAWFSAPDA